MGIPVFGMMVFTHKLTPGTMKPYKESVMDLIKN